MEQEKHGGTRVAIVGAGAWGTALSLVVRRAGGTPVIWARETEVAALINSARENPLFLPGIRLDREIRATNEMAELAGSDVVLLATPAQFVRETLARLVPALGASRPCVLCAKGIERGTLSLMSEVAAETAPGFPIAVLSGPTFAVEVAHDLPTAVTLACADRAVGETMARVLGSRRFRVYLADDVIGAELGGAVKNVIAIACGITIGRKLGDNARAALITRGLAEIVRLGLAMGAKVSTMMGLSGLGDLTLTCNGTQSRNTSLGIALGRGERLAHVLARGVSVSEGVFSADAVRQLAERHGIEMPICFAVDRVLNHGADIDVAIRSLLDRPVGDEMEGIEANILDRHGGLS
ncbi:MAG: NAD(P)H-dependent glycerol-3-phosphate dehydrogenase [Alphaproteobacteria bacterium]